MPQRFISLYYASIGNTRAIHAIGAWAAGPLASPAERRADLAEAVRQHVGGASIFSVGSARSALALCLIGAGLGAKDEVLLSSYTCIAVATGVIAAGARPVYSDIDPVTLNTDVASVVAALGPNVRAVVVQHTLGKPAQIHAIADAARARGILVIEDCALAVGSSIGQQQVGTFGDASIFSMELSKTISSGWGGILVVHDTSLAARVARVYDSIREPSSVASARDLWQTAISAWCHQPGLYSGVGKYALYAGFKSGMFRRSTPPCEFEGRIAAGFLRKMGSAQAALAAMQWRDLSAIAEQCERNARKLRQVLKELRISAPGTPAGGEFCVSPRVSFLVLDRPLVMQFFRAYGIELGEWFDGPISPIPSSPLFNWQPGKYSNAELIARHVVNLPCHSRLDVRDIAHIEGTLRRLEHDHPECLVRDDR